jgi:hypothetical protein
MSFFDYAWLPEITQNLRKFFAPYTVSDQVNTINSEISTINAEISAINTNVSDLGQIFSELTILNGAIANNANYQGDIQLQKKYISIVRIATNFPCRLRLYVNGAYANNDLNRQQTNYINQTIDGLLFEGYFILNKEFIVLSPQVLAYFAFNSVSFTVTNLSGSSVDGGSIILQYLSNSLN